jgi:hypothetical protein
MAYLSAAADFEVSQVVDAVKDAPHDRQARLRGLILTDQRRLRLLLIVA